MFSSENKPVLESSTELSKTGYFQLSWDMPGIDGSSNFILEKDTKASFDDAIELYTGRDKTTFISGLKNGDYFYRVRLSNRDNTESDIIKVKVEHYTKSFAFILFGFGLIVFMSTVWIVLKGSMNSNR